MNYMAIFVGTMLYRRCAHHLYNVHIFPTQRTKSTIYTNFIFLKT